MPRQRLRELLAELRRELHEPDDLDDAARELLQGIHDDIDAFIAAGTPNDSASPVLDRTRASVDRFEGSHPRLTALIQRIADTLSGAGF